MAQKDPPTHGTEGLLPILHRSRLMLPVQTVEMQVHLVSSSTASSARLQPKNPGSLIVATSDAAVHGQAAFGAGEQRRLADECPVVHATGHLIHVPHLLAEHHEVLIDHILVKPNGCFHLLNESTLPFRVTNLLRKTRKGIGSPWFIRFRDGPLGTSPHIQPIVRQHDWW